MVTVKQLHCSWRPKMMIYINNMITWKRKKNVLPMFSAIQKSGRIRPWWVITPFFWNITINNVDGDIMPLCLEKKMIIYSDNMIDWQYTSNVSSNPNVAISHGSSCIRPLLAQSRHIIDPGWFFTSGPSAERRHNISAVPLQGRLPSTASSPL